MLSKFNQFKVNIMRINQIILLALILSILPLHAVHSQHAIENSYIILFKEDANVIDPPNPANAGKVPMGQPTSGQNKEDLAVTLGLQGEIAIILEVNNGIVVKMDAQEAEKWRQDPRVSSVEQEMYLAAFTDNDQIKDDHPFYQDGILLIPRVDTEEQPGLFQNGVFEFDPVLGAWRLLNFDINPVLEWLIPQVELIILESFPVQVFLKLSGSVTACSDLKINQRFKENRFEISVIPFSTLGPDTACIAVVLPFEKIIPLQVYGLPAGTYEYIVNNHYTGTFELANDNNL